MAKKIVIYTHPQCKLPDHSLLVLTFQTDEVAVSDCMISEVVQLGKHPRNNVRNVPPHLFSSSECQSILTELTNKLTQVQHQKEIDKWYDEFCKYIRNVTAACRKPLSSGRGGLSKKYKPYSNRQLKAMWEEIRMAERTFLKMN